MGIRQPGMEWYESSLQSETKHEEDRTEEDERSTGSLREKTGNVCHVEMTCACVDRSDAEKDECRSDPSQYHVLESRFKRFVLRTECDQTVGCDRSDLHEYVEVEDVSTQGHTIHACDHEQQQCVVLRL